MQSGNNEEYIDLIFERIDDASVLSNFFCGIPDMDDLIHEKLQGYPAYMVDILSEETKALQPDLVELGHKEYEKQFRVYRKAYMKELTALAEQGDKYGQFFLAEEYKRGVHKRFINLIQAGRTI